MEKIIFMILFLVWDSECALLFSQYVQHGSKLVGSGVTENSYFGQSVAISADGNSAIIGCPGDSQYKGAACIFIRNGNLWTQQGSKLIGNDTNGIFVDFGVSVAISYDGNTAIIGGPGDNRGKGAAWIFTRSGNIWTQQGKKLEGKGVNGLSTQGCSVAISSDGSTAVVGGMGENSTGAVWVFTRIGNNWTQQGPKLTGSGSIDTSYQGWSVAISSDGNTLVEGGYKDNHFTGAIWVFTRIGNTWIQQGQKLIGIDTIGHAAQGYAVTVSSDGNTIIEGGPSDNNAVGAVWLFHRNNGIWSQYGNKLIGTGAIGQAGQGSSVSISSDGNTFVEGGRLDNQYIGAFWVFTQINGVWTQQSSKLVGNGYIGYSNQGNSTVISSDSHTIIESGLGDNNDLGAVWVFVNPGIGIRQIYSEVPDKFSLSQNYPNPFNPATKIRFSVPLFSQGGVSRKDGVVSLKVYNAFGQEITTLVNEQLKPGIYSVDWNACKLPEWCIFL